MSEIKEKAPLSEEGLRGDGTPRWYVIHTYSGHENKVKINIEKLVENRGMEDLILEVAIPTEEKAELKDGKMVLKTRKLFPGYVIVKMIITNESWYLVRNTQGVTGFVGNGLNPTPLSVDLKPGDQIKVINGPFEGMVGEVEEVNEEKMTVRAKISMFSRETPVELEFAQIDKI